MLRRTPVAVSVAALAAALPAQHVACEKYQLDNGLTVILHVDHSLPVVAINTWFQAGARNEPPGRSGFAHLFEHLMFMGTERVPDNQFDVIMEGGGGSNNASTTLDRTAFYAQGPASLLPTLLWLDADRLEDLGRTMDQAKLDRQREVVRNEMRQEVENRPYGRADEAVFALMFPAGHPYHAGVFGTHADLEAATVFDVKDFFASFYVPNNASLVVAGDFDPAAVQPLLAELFGSLPRGGEVAAVTAPPPQLDGVRRRTMLDRVQLPLVKMAWHSPPAFADGDAELQLLAALLSHGKDSLLYRRLVLDEQLAVDVSAYQDGAALGSLFQIDVTAVPGADLDRIEAAVLDELQRLQQRPVEPQELQQRQVGYELRTLASLQSLQRKAELLNQYQHVWGQPDGFARDLERFRGATPGQLQQAAQRVFGQPGRGVIRVLPEDVERAPSARDTRPAPAKAAAFTPPMPQGFTLGNGMPVWLWRKSDLPLVALTVQFQPGWVLTEPQQAGLPALMASMLDEGAGERDATAFAAAMQQLGGWFATWADHETASASLTVLKRNFGAAAGLVADALRRPRLQAGDWERVKRLHLEGLRQADDDAEAVAQRVGLRLLFGAGSPYGWPIGGTVDTVAPLTLADVQRQRQRLLQPNHAVLLLAGDLTVDEAKAALEPALGDWQAAAAPAVAQPPLLPQPAQQLRIAVVDRPEAVQTVIRFFAPGRTYRDPQRMPLQLLNSLLGGGFTSRLNQNLREQHGYTYGAGSGYAMSPFGGWFTAGAAVETPVTGAALREFLAEFARLAGSGDITDAEAQKARETLRTATIDAFASLNGVLANACEQALNHLPFDQVGKDLATVAATGAAELNAIAAAALPIAAGVVVLVGDQAAILEQLQGLELPSKPQVYDAQGRPVGG